MATEAIRQQLSASPASNLTGYRNFEIGSFTFSRDEYFAHIKWRTKEGKFMQHVMSADAFLRALMRDVAWGFFYGRVDFDPVFGTQNHYGTVDMYAGAFHPAYRDKGLSINERFDSRDLMATFRAILDDWTNKSFDPFAAPAETGPSWFGKKDGSNRNAIERERQACKRMPGLPGDADLRSDANGYPVNRAFADVPQDPPEVHAEPGFEGQVHAINLFAYLSRSDVTWNPSVSSVVRGSLFCPTTEEYILPIKHGNDRVEWFLQFSDEIEWEIEDKNTGLPRAKVLMKAGDVSSMPADIRHQGFSRKRSMLLVWENATPGLVDLHESGKIPPYPVEF